ncbi:MAG: RDD family protein [Acidobacteriota bacterium]
MSRRRRPAGDDLPLFDLPLRSGDGADDGQELSEPTPPATEAPVAPRREAPEPVAQPAAETAAGTKTASLFGPEDFEPGATTGDAWHGGAVADGALPEGVEDGDWIAVEVTLQDRLLGGFLDLALNLIVFGLVVLVVRLPLGVPVRWDDWPAFAVFGVIFTFLYWTVPLAFWGQTPGMAWAGHAARSVTDEPLTFGQTVLRWIGSLLTVALAGLPLLLVLFGSRSLSDRLSDSKTLEV